MNPKPKFKAGFVSIVGKPNVGKSTLLNALLGQKISITANKPQTTRQLIRGIQTKENHQIIFIDTPGIQKEQSNNKNQSVLMNKRMNQSAKSSLHDVDLILFMTDTSERFNEDEMEIIQSFSQAIPVYLVVNKIDMLNDEEKLLQLLKEKSQAYPFKEVIPVSSFNKTNLKRLNQTMVQDIPESEMLYDEADITDSPLYRRVEEMIREKCMRDLHNEVPFQVAVSVQKIERGEKLVKIWADIWVGSLGHKKIVIGDGGSMIKSIGTHARFNLEKNIFHQKVYLELFVKVQKDWFNRTNLLDNLCI